MNHVRVTAHGSPHSFVRAVQHDPDVAISLLSALEAALTCLKHDRDSNGGRGYNATIESCEKTLAEAKEWYRKCPE